MNKLPNKARFLKGFTLVELIVVMVILAILAGLLIPSLKGYIDKADEAEIIAEARETYTAVQTALSEVYGMSPEKLAKTTERIYVEIPEELGGKEGEMVLCGVVADNCFGDMQHGNAFQQAQKEKDPYFIVAKKALYLLDSAHEDAEAKRRYVFAKDYKKNGNSGYHYLSDVDLDTYFRKTHHTNSITAFYNKYGQIIFFEYARKDSDIIVKMTKDALIVEHKSVGAHAEWKIPS